MSESTFPCKNIDLLSFLDSLKPMLLDVGSNSSKWPAASL